MKAKGFRLTISCVACILLAGTALSAAQEETPSFTDVLNLKSPGSVRLSPDGKYVLYIVSEPNWDKNSYTTQLWLADVAARENRQLTYQEKSSSNPDWSPDGKYISFVSARDEKSQVYAMYAFGGEARAITSSETGVGGYEWSPDGKWIAYTATDDMSKHQKAIEKKYGRFTIFNEEFNANHLWLVEVESGKTEKLVEREDLNVTGFEWSPDGKRIAFSATPDTRIESFSKSDIFVVDLESKDVRPLVVQPGPDSGPVWSPDGVAIAFSSKMGTETYFTNGFICSIPVDGGEIINLTKSFDENPSMITWNDNGIYFSALQGMSRHLFRLNPVDGDIVDITPGKKMLLSSMSFSRDGVTIACIIRDATHYPELYLSTVADFKPVKLTDFTRQLEGWKLSTKEPVSWSSSDGTEITGVLIKPADFDPAKKYPLLVIIHGGPSSISYPQYLDGYNRVYPIEQWTAKGAVILEPNYRGSTGFGEAFRKLNYRNLGVGDYWDVISGVDYLISQGYVDSERIGAMGWSQGGYISAFITTYSDRFKAISVGAGISDWITYYVNTDIPPFTRHYLGATPWDDEEVYRKTSPMTYINNAKTPTLIQHGEFDRRVPIPNAYKLYRGLMDKGVPVRFVIYKGFGHGISKPKERLAVLQHNFEWFNKYIWGEEPEEEQLMEEPDAGEKKK